MRVRVRLCVRDRFIIETKESAILFNTIAC